MFYLPGLLKGLDEVVSAEHLARCLAHGIQWILIHVLMRFLIIKGTTVM